MRFNWINLIVKYKSTVLYFVQYNDLREGVIKIIELYLYEWGSK